ncbi:MAG: FHA domain-containing protein, partial [Acidobacteriota bacterium]
MAELWLKYKDAAGEEKRVCVDKERFTVGRHSDNDLAIVDGRLSRDHAVIERFGDVFVITDRESSNGTELNGEAISEPATIANGDKLSLGGLDVEPEFVSDAGEASPDEQGGAEQAPASAAAPAAQADPGSGIPKAVFIVAPIFAVLILLGLGSLLFFGRTKPAANPVDISYSDKDESLTDKPKKDKDRSDPIRDRTDPVNAESPSANTTTTATTPPSTVTEPGIAKTEVNGSAFMRKIAQNDPRAFLIGEPAKEVYSKIKSISSSAALASNIASARKNSAA